MGKSQAAAWPADELASFLAEFLHGLLHEGLTQPLERWARGRDGAVAQSARCWHALMAAGKAPEVALAAVTPPFPTPVADLLLLGLQSGALDYVVEDMLGALGGKDSQGACELLLAEYRKRAPGTTVCEGCIAREITRIVQRARVEEAAEVRISWDEAGFMEQRYFGPYVVIVKQPSRPGVVQAIRSRLSRNGPVADEPDTHVIDREGRKLKVVLEG